MSTGLMTLAYMGEMAMVFNLAYLELNKGRYIAGPKASIAKLRDTIEVSPAVGNENDWIRGKTKIVDRLQKLVADEPKERQHSWYVETDRVNHSDWLARDGYDIFEKEKDKNLCQHSLILCVMLLIAITVLDNLGHSNYDLASWVLITESLLFVSAFLWLGHFLYAQLRRLAMVVLTSCVVSTAIATTSSLQFQVQTFYVSIWWLYFLFFLLTALAPIVCIHFGRRVQRSLDESIGDAKREFEDLKAKALPNGGNSGFGNETIL